MNLYLKNAIIIFFKEISDRFNIRMETTGERLSELEDRSIEIIQAEERRKNMLKSKCISYIIANGLT